MKSVRKYSAIIITIVIAALVIFKLFANKKHIEGDLKAMQEYSSVIPVEIVLPQSSAAKQTLEENGTLRSGAEVSILSETSGKVTAVNGNIGESIRAGHVLATVEKTVLESQFKLAKVSLENAERDLKRYSNMVEGEAVTQQQLDASKLNYQSALANYTNLQNQLENTVIKSPVNGYISKRSIEKGTFISPATELFTILERDQMIFVVKISDNNIYQLSKGQAVSITLDAIPGETFKGSVRSIGISPDLSGRYEIEVSIREQKSLLRPGMSGKAIFENNMKEAGMIIPRKCIVGSVKDASLFIVKGDSVVSKKVNAVAVNESQVLITGGISPNEKVVLSGQINLQNGSKVNIINQ